MSDNVQSTESTTTPSPPETAINAVAHSPLAERLWQRHVHEPGVIPLATTRGIVQRIQRWGLNRTPLLRRLQRHSARTSDLGGGGVLLYAGLSARPERPFLSDEPNASAFSSPAAPTGVPQGPPSGDVTAALPVVIARQTNTAMPAESPSPRIGQQMFTPGVNIHPARPDWGNDAPGESSAGHIQQAAMASTSPSTRATSLTTRGEERRQVTVPNQAAASPVQFSAVQFPLPAPTRTTDRVVQRMPTVPAVAAPGDVMTPVGTSMNRASSVSPIGFTVAAHELGAPTSGGHSADMQATGDVNVDVGAAILQRSLRGPARELLQRQMNLEKSSPTERPVGAAPLATNILQRTMDGPAKRLQARPTVPPTPMQVEGRQISKRESQPVASSRATTSALGAPTDEGQRLPELQPFAVASAPSAAVTLPVVLAQTPGTGGTAVQPKLTSVRPDPVDFPLLEVTNQASPPTLPQVGGGTVTGHPTVPSLIRGGLGRGESLLPESGGISDRAGREPGIGATWGASQADSSPSQRTAPFVVATKLSNAPASVQLHQEMPPRAAALMSEIPPGVLPPVVDQPGASSPLAGAIQPMPLPLVRTATVTPALQRQSATPVTPLGASFPLPTTNGATALGVDRSMVGGGALGRQADRPGSMGNNQSAALPLPVVKRTLNNQGSMLARQTTPGAATDVVGGSSMAAPVNQAETSTSLAPAATAEIDVNQLAEQVSRIILHQLAIERERRGIGRWH